MNRRNFIKDSCSACVLFSSGILLSSLLDSCGTSLSVFKTSANNNQVQIPLAGFDENNFKLVRVSNYNYDIAVQKLSDGSFEALVMMCTHAGNPLTKTGEGYYCPLHGSKFNADGQVLKGPAERPLIHLKTQQSENNLLITLQPAHV